MRPRSRFCQSWDSHRGGIRAYGARGGRSVGLRSSVARSFPHGKCISLTPPWGSVFLNQCTYLYESTIVEGLSLFNLRVCTHKLSTRNYYSSDFELCLGNQK